MKKVMGIIILALAGLMMLNVGLISAQEADPEAEDENGKVAGSRQGYVGTFTTGETDGTFIVETKKGDVTIKIDTPLASITSQAQGSPTHGDRVAVLIEFVDDGEGGLTKVAVQVIVKPASPVLPVVGAVVSTETAENGVRTMTIMRPNGTTKVVELGAKDQLPVVGDVVIAFQGRGRGPDGAGEQGGRPVITGLVRAEEVSQRLEGILEDLTSEDGELPPQAVERRAQRVARVAALLEDHAAKHVEIIQRVSQNENLPAQAVAGMQNGLERAQGGLVEARARGTEARTNAGPPSEIGVQGQGGRGN